MEISLEIIPRSYPSLKEDFLLCQSCSPINCFNVPDLTRFSIRSWEACSALADDHRGAALIPHLRARDFSLRGPFPLRELFRKWGITKALVIAGDPPEEASGSGRSFSSGVEASSTLSFIKKLKGEMPELEIYAAFDPYRTNIRYELDYLAAKEEAGAAGFMSQPFFDLRLLEIYAEYLEGKKIFWGVAPVLTGGNRAYWESRNRAVFPRSFRADPEWNIGFARRVMDFCRANQFNLYLMPIKMDLRSYLSGIFK
jgi:methylenetetrahydrofolate reductase (NADPH)